MHAEKLASIVNGDAHGAYSVAFSAIAGVDVKTDCGAIVKTVEIVDVDTANQSSRGTQNYNEANGAGGVYVVAVVDGIIPKLFSAEGCAGVARFPLRGVVFPLHHRVDIGDFDCAECEYVVL